MDLLEQMNSDLGIDKKYILYASKRNDLYSRYYIKKKNGGVRKILQPSKELKALQYWLVNNIFCEFPISQYSTAYQKKCSVKKNAEYHKNNKYIFHTDIQNFFESITRDMMEIFFEKNKNIVDKLQLTTEEIMLIMDLILYKGKNLVVGSVSSPTVSNRIMYDFDIKLVQLLDENMIYTRYADDIIISSPNYINETIIEDVKKLLKECGFEMNLDKTYFMNKCKKREVTGIVIDNNNNSLSIGRKRYVKLKKEIYNYLIKGQGERSHIIGMLSYLQDINKSKYLSLQETYKKYDKNNKIF